MPSPTTIQDLKTAIGGIDDEIRGMDERKAELQRQRRALVTTLQFFGEDDDVPDSPRTPVVRSLWTSEIPDAIYGILETAGTLHRQDIYERLEDMGARIGGQNPVSSMGEYLRRDPRFESLGGGMWTLSRQSGDDAGDSSGAVGLDDAIFAVLSAERPMHRSDIHDRVVEMGVKVRGLNPVNNVTAHMSLDPRFHSVGGGMWDLVDPPAANEDDDTQDEEDEEDNVPW